MEEKKVFIGIPTMGNVPWQFCSSLRALDLSYQTKICWSVRTMIHTARNLLVRNFLKSDYTHLLQIDDDMIFEPDFLNKLLNQDVEIVGGLATKRRPPYQPCVYRQNKKTKRFHSIVPDIFQEVDSIGTGGILIKREVFEKIPFPWFETWYDSEGSNYSVDFDFCIKAKKAGIKIFIDPEARMAHIGDPEIATIEKSITYNKQKEK